MHYTFTIELMELFHSITDHIPILRIGTKPHDCIMSSFITPMFFMEAQMPIMTIKMLCVLNN